MKINRLYHRFRAFLGGYFWLPCDKCGQYFGGHEWDYIHIGVETDNPHIFEGICNQCAKEIASRHPKGATISLERGTFKERVTGYRFP